MLKILDRPFSAAYDQLNTDCFNQETSFWINPRLLKWSEADDRSLVLGLFKNEELVASMTCQIFVSAKHLTTRLLGLSEEALPSDLRFPLLYISRSATDPDHTKRGMNTRLRVVALSIAKGLGFSQACTTVLEGSPRLNTMIEMGYRFVVNPRKWNTESYRSPKVPLVGFINLAEVDDFLEKSLTAEDTQFLEKNQTVFKVWSDNYLSQNQSQNEIQYTRNNHFEFGFNNIKSSARKLPSDEFFVRYGRCEQEPLDFKSECTNAAREIFRSRQKPLYLCLSGGVDSEVMCEAFRMAGVPFKIIIARFNQNLNEHDYSWAVRYCQKHGLDFQFYDLDALLFFESTEYHWMLRSTGCGYPMLATAMKLMQHVARDLRGVPILGSAECQLKRIGRQWVLIEPEPIQSLYRYLSFNGYDGIPGFFQWNPEVMLAFLRDPLLQKIVENSEIGVVSSLKIKGVIYNRYFGIEPRPKFRGYEKFEELIIKKRSELRRIYIGPMVEARFEYHQLLKQLAPVPRQELAKGL